MKSDALISYQPPFNLLAFVILWPASFILSPRALHSLNVFLIRLTVRCSRLRLSVLIPTSCLQSFPILIAIHLYERFMLTHDSPWVSTQSAVHSAFHSLPRAIKSLPVLEAMLRTDSSTVYEAIFDVETDLEDAEDDTDRDLFGSDAEDGRDVGLHSWTSRPSANGRERGDVLPAIRTPPRNRAAEREQRSMDRGRSAPSSPSKQPKLRLSPSQTRNIRVSDAPSLGSRSPLARLFGARAELAQVDTRGADIKLDESVRRISDMLEEAKDLPVNSLKAEMKELQQRQARIENLLLTLTRGMRHETGSSTPGSHL